MNQKIKSQTAITILALLLLALSGCQSAAPTAPTAEENPVVTATIKALPKTARSSATPSVTVSFYGI